MCALNKFNEIGIYNWENIENKYHSSSILLGNGFSMNFSNNLRYKYLHSNFIENCSEKAKALFQSFNTTNFEEVLQKIEISEKVCYSLFEEKLNFNDVHDEIRTGLINSIHRIHPSHAEISMSRISRVAQEFEPFSDIFTTNYDLFSYYLILEIRKLKQFGDFFFFNYNSEMKSFQAPDRLPKRHIYFLHGALFIFQIGPVTTKLLSPTDKWLLDAITEKIMSNKYPVFVSEGSHQRKLEYVMTNPYLNFCYRRLKTKSKENKRIVIFGQSLSPQDEHVVRALDENYEHIAISIYTQNKEKAVLHQEKKRIMAQFKHSELEFFDSSTLFSFE